MINAYFHVTMFAHTCILNHSLFRMHFHYDSINKPLLAGQEEKRDFILANKDQALIVQLADKASSKSIKIKTAGIKDDFTIVTNNNNGSVSNNNASNNRHSARFGGGGGGDDEIIEGDEEQGSSVRASNR